VVGRVGGDQAPCRVLQLAMCGLVRRPEGEAGVEDSVDLRWVRYLSRRPGVFGNRAEHAVYGLAVAELRRKSGLEAMRWRSR
jgi:hypothetical protein